MQKVIRHVIFISEYQIRGDVLCGGVSPVDPDGVPAGEAGSFYVSAVGISDHPQVVCRQMHPLLRDAVDGRIRLRGADLTGDHHHGIHLPSPSI